MMKPKEQRKLKMLEDKDKLKKQKPQILLNKDKSKRKKSKNDEFYYSIKVHINWQLLTMRI